MGDIARMKSSDLAVPGKRLRIGWQLPKGMDFDEWLECGRTLREIEGSVQWWIGDWWRYGEDRKEYGTGRETAELVGFDYQTCRNAAWVASEFQLSRRRDNLSFTHHADVAALPPSKQDEWLDIAERDKLSSKQLRSVIFQSKIDAKKLEFASLGGDLPSGVYVGDFRELSPQVISDSSVELVFIDPPYDEGAIPLYEAAALEAARILKPGGSLISYCGHTQLPCVLPLMSAYLKYYWIGADVHDGGPMAQMIRFGIQVGFKPLLWFVKEYRVDVQSYIVDTILHKREKDIHPWQQAEATAEHFISRLTTPAGLVIDFFAGGGTTATVAKRLGRRWITFEIDETVINKLVERVS